MHLKTDNTWTIFLDRDGVINKRLPGDYVADISQFELLGGTLEAIRIFSELFRKIIVVTNQQGIGKGLMTTKDLDLIHQHFIDKVIEAGGRIDAIYESPYHHSERQFSRKPSVGMGISAKKQFKEINFRKSIMAGDSKSDMLFGKRLGMKTVYIGSHTEARELRGLADFCFPDLLSLANALS